MWPTYRNWQDFKAAIIMLTKVRENKLIMNEKMGNLRWETEYNKNQMKKKIFLF